MGQQGIGSERGRKDMRFELPQVDAWGPGDMRIGKQEWVQRDKMRARTDIAVGQVEQCTVVEVRQTGETVAAQLLSRTVRIARTAGVARTAAGVDRIVAGVARIAGAAHTVEAAEAAHTVAARHIAGEPVVYTRSGTAMPHVPLAQLIADRTASPLETACRASRTTYALSFLCRPSCVQVSALNRSPVRTYPPPVARFVHL